MIPEQLNKLLRETLPEQFWRTRLEEDGPRRYIEFGPLDVDLLKRLGVEVDDLGPHLVVCMWDEESPLPIGGYLVVDNLAMGRPSMGGIRMMSSVTPGAIHNLARGMTLKNAAADLPFGGGKSGIVASGDLPATEHTAVIRGFARLIARYRAIYLPGPDVGTDDADMKTIAIENGLHGAVSKTEDMGGNRIDLLGAAAQGVVVAIETLLQEIHRLKVLPQFADLEVPSREELTVLIQGFGAVGTHVARLLSGEDPAAPRINGVSDISGAIYDPAGLPVAELLAMQQEFGNVALPYYQKHLQGQRGSATKFSNAGDDLLREPAFCLVPASPVANYLDVDAASQPSMTVDRMARWTMIVEGANTYSPAKTRQAARRRMERVVYWQKGVLIATDFLVNSGGVIYAAQEQLIEGAADLRIPQAALGDRAAVNAWLAEHEEAFAALAEQRRAAGRAQVESVISRNMRELIDLLVSDPDLLPCEAAEKIAISRIAASESDRTVADVMVPIAEVGLGQSIREAAEMLINQHDDMLAVVSTGGKLAGVLTDRDITRALAQGLGHGEPVGRIMTTRVVSACVEDKILDVVRKLEHFSISAVPVVLDSRAIGLVSSDILARRTLYRLLQAQP